jgi:hypothetical protein
VLTGARAVVKRWRDGGKEWRRLELVVRVKELEREGERSGESRGLLSPFIGAEGAPGRGGWGGNGGVNSFNAIEDGARLRGLRRALMAGRVKARRQPLKARSWVARGGRTWRDSVAAQPGLAGAGWERELIGGAHASARGEREGAEDERRESKKKAYSVKYTKAGQ